MTENQLLKNLSVPEHPVDVVIDTDAFNEIDDQYAIAYLLSSSEKLNVKAIYAAPFFNEISTSPKDGMEKSYAEIIKLLELMDTSELKNVVFKGSDEYLPDEKTPVISDAAQHLADLATNYTPDNPLYVVEIAAITTVASAILINPEIQKNIVVVWLGGHSLEYHDTKEFNMKQDIAAARVIMSHEIPFVQLPCVGVVDTFRISKPELEFWLKGKNKLCDYLVDHTIRTAEVYAVGMAWTRVIWDVTAVAWLLNDGDQFMESKIINKHIPNYDFQYNLTNNNGFMRYVYSINRDELMTDLIKKLTK